MKNLRDTQRKQSANGLSAGLLELIKKLGDQLAACEYQKMGLEKLYRYVQGARYQPIYKADQLQLSGSYLQHQ